MASIQDIRNEAERVRIALDALVDLIEEGVESNVDVATLKASIVDLVVEHAETVATATAEYIADEVRYMTAEVDTYGLDGDVAGLVQALGLE